MKKILILTGLAIAALAPTDADAQTMAILTNANQLLVVRDITRPDSSDPVYPITGLDTGHVMVSIDHRPSTGELYGLGYNLSTNEARLYSINMFAGAATPLGSIVTLMLGASTSISMDFSPAEDAVRVVGENGMNYRLDPVTGAIVSTDDTVSFVSGDVNSGITPHIGAIAYTNSYMGSGSAELYGYDEALNVITRFNNPNSGSMQTRGSSGITLNMDSRTVGMDIFKDAATLTNMAYLAANTDSSYYDSLYSVNLSTGAVANLGAIGHNIDVRDISIQTVRELPPLTGPMVYGLQKGTTNLFNFDSNLPKNIRSIKTITGIPIGQTIVGMDFRPSTFELYLLGYNEITTTAQLYVLNMLTYEADPVARAATMDLGTGGHIGFDFNPMTEEIRVVSSANQANYRLNPTTVVVISADVNLAYAAADAHAGVKPNIGSIAYINNFSSANTTTIFGIDDSLGALVTIDPANNGTVTTSSANFLTPNLSDRTSDIDFFYDSASASTVGYITFNTSADVNDQLYHYTASGGLTPMNAIGFGIQVADIAVQPQYRGALSVAENELKRKVLTIYPNPVTDVLSVSGLDMSGAKATIFDMSGKVVSTQQLLKNSILTANLPAGNYILSIDAKNSAFAPATFVKK
ncbi:MAG: DUF4394 domain-containing protein [Sphingobacteriales bacterium]|nr:MAG: DUF4394 domain-containing protein [Sphingobacteriales bacterium]